MADHVMTVEEIARYLNMKSGTIYKHAREGKIPGFKVGASWRFKMDTINEWIESQEKKVVHSDARGMERII